LGNIGMNLSPTDKMKIKIPADGVHRTTSPDGKPSEEYTIKNGKEHGIHRRWHENGQVSYEWSYYRGEMNGRMRWWAEDGMLCGQCYYFDGRPISKKGYQAKCRVIPGLPSFEDEKTTNTLGNYVRRLRRAKREQAKLGPSPEQLEEERCFDEECKAETKQKASKELVSWLRKRAKQEKELGELSQSEALRLARKLYGLGAVRIWATNIERDEDGAQYSRRLILALPKASLKRSKIYELCADPARPFIGGDSPAISLGKNFMSVSLM
jgi:antitoxin component YwqK of YwqJK toxin-antitoxin module